jgi:hypothetical protein
MSDSRECRTYLSLFTRVPNSENKYFGINCEKQRYVSLFWSVATVKMRDFRTGQL